jgi:hypothetical protein
MINELMATERAMELIAQGRALAVAGPEPELQRLPRGRWIGGTIPYFMPAEGGTVARSGRVFVSELSALGDVHVAHHPADDLAGIVRDAPENGFSYTIIPAGSAAHRRFAADAAGYEGAFLKPTVGWIAGVHLEDLGHAEPRVYDGRTGTAHADGAVVAYVELPAHQAASVEIVNLFEPDATDVLRFDATSFSVRECRVNGERVSFADYLQQRGLAGGQLPLVGDFAGAHVNVSIQGVADDGTVNLYAPVFDGVDYRFARPIADFAAAFQQRLAGVAPQGVVLGCNCILNFLFGQLEGKAIGGVAGPVTFGEIAFQLLNQTMVMVRIV